MPQGALVAFVAVAVPAILLMSVWAGAAAFRLLFPENEDLATPAARRALGEAAPVRLRDIRADQEARRAVAARTPAAPAGPAANPLFDDLWLRRN